MPAPYVMRMKEELANLDENRRKLKYFLKGPTSKDLPAEKRELMEKQVEAMEQYKAILQARLDLE